jgi:hypothetical protein
VKRHVTLAVIACLAVSSFVALAPSVASAADTRAECFPPGVQGDYPPAQPGVERDLTLSLADGFLKPTTTSLNALVLLHANPNLDYCGILASNPVTLPVTTSSSSGVIHFDDIALPSDFQLNALHHLDVYRQGALVGAFDFCVNLQGHLVGANQCPGANVLPGVKTGGLAHTGLARLADFLKAAGVAFAAGVLFLYLRRRRAASVAQI